MGCRVTRVAKGYMGCRFFKNQNPYTICSGVMNSEGCVFGLQGYKGYKRLHGLHIFLKSESNTICSGVMNSEGCVFGLQGYKGCEMLHGLQIFQNSESLYYMQWSDEF